MTTVDPETFVYRRLWEPDVWDPSLLDVLAADRQVIASHSGVDRA